MSTGNDFRTAFCPEYETLLHECQNTKEACAEWRTEMNSPDSTNKLNLEASGGLLRLQAKYAKAYTRLEHHHLDCDRCQFVAQLTEYQRENGNVFAAAEESWPA